MIQDLDGPQTVEVEQDGKRFPLRSEVQGSCGTVFCSAGVAGPPTRSRSSQIPPPQSQIRVSRRHCEFVNSCTTIGCGCRR